MINYQIYSTNRPLDVIQHWKHSNYLDLNPPYQRGEVWGETRQRNLIRSIVIGIPVASIIINDRTRSEWGRNLTKGFLAVVDGKQRITTIIKFLYSNLKVPGEWFGMEGDVVFSDLPIHIQRGFRQIPIAFSEASLPSLEQEQEVFDLVNFGGVPQGESDI